MNNLFQVKLSSRELLVLAALLGYDSVFGVEDSDALCGSFDLKTLVRKSVQQLERKKLVRYDLDGTLYINPHLRQAMACVCNADTVGFFSTNLRSGKKILVYVLQKDTCVTTLQQASAGKYKLLLSDSVQEDLLIPGDIHTPKQLQLQEMMLLEEAQLAKEHMRSFDVDAAEERVSKHVQNADAARYVAKILSGNCGYLSVQLYRKTPLLYKAAYAGLFVAVDGRAISLSLDENRVIRFKALTHGEAAGSILPHLCPGTKEGIT